MITSSGSSLRRRRPRLVEQRLDLALLRGCRQHDDRDLGALLAHEPCDLDAVEARQPVVEQDHVRLMLLAELHGLFAALLRGDDLDVTAQLEQQLERLAEDVVVSIRTTRVSTG